jgi:N-acetylglutamate synthase
MSWTVEQMTIEDYDEVVALWQQTGGVHVDAEGSDSREAIERYLRRNPGSSFVARQAGRLVAAVLCGHDGRRAYVNHLAVDADHRGRGIGRTLVERCAETMRQQGITRCILYVYAANQPALGFWRKLGFEDFEDHDVKTFIGRLS